MQFDHHFFCTQQLLLGNKNHVICFSQSQLLLAKTNQDQTLGQKGLYLAHQGIRFVIGTPFSRVPNVGGIVLYIVTLVHCLIEVHVRR